MPNWVRCQFRNISDMEKFKQLAIDKKRGDIDFNLLLPMPETLNIVRPQRGELPKDFEFPTIEDETQLDGFLQYCADQGVNISLALAHWNNGKYGFADWYDWRIAHWGTKWNAVSGISGEWDSGDYFETAWSMPENWLRELAKHLDFTLDYADEDMGSNCGRVTSSDGVFDITHPDTDAEALAFAYYIHYGDCAETALKDDAKANPENYDLQDAAENYNELINNWI